MDIEQIIRIFVFGALLLLMLLWETLSPRRRVIARPGLRRLNNLLLLLVDVAVTALLFPVAAVGSAVIASDMQWGLFNQVDINPLYSIIISFFLLDLLIYWQHVLFHKIPLLWRIHRVHHTDAHIDVTTGIRFHPVEIILSMILKMAFIMLLGAPVIAVILFEITLFSLAMFNHGNVNIPVTLDRYLRYLLVTPDMHRVHHSQIRYETNSNFGFCIPWWDRFFSTYREQPELGHQRMKIGLKEFEDQDVVNLMSLIKQPFTGIHK
ncbi:MAG TPA: sterol desaturase family protein [Gammaproteobacteria bacterium]